MVKNLVIGSEGFIGKPFCQFLEEKGEEVVRFDIKRKKSEDARTFKFDFNGIDRIYFLAWDVGGSKYLYESKLQLSQLQWNLKLMENIFEQLGKQKTKFLFASSQLSEEVDTVYGVTKRLGEVWTKELGGICIRIWNAYGVMENRDIKSHVMSDFIYQALETGKIKMMTDGNEWRQFTHIDDLSRAFHSALSLKGLTRNVYDASSYEWVRIIDIAKIISELTGAKLFPGQKKGYDPIPSQNMGRLPGWMPEVTLREGLLKMVEQARLKNKNGKKK